MFIMSTLACQHVTQHNNISFSRGKSIIPPAFSGPNLTRAVLLTRLPFPSLRMVSENVFEAGRYADGKREEHRHGRLSHLNDEFIRLRCSSIIFHVVIWLRHDDLSVFKPSLRTPLGLMSRDNWTRRGWHFPSGSPKSWKSQLYSGVNTCQNSVSKNRRWSPASSALSVETGWKT